MLEVKWYGTTDMAQLTCLKQYGSTYMTQTTWPKVERNPSLYIIVLGGIWKEILLSTIQNI